MTRFKSPNTRQFADAMREKRPLFLISSPRREAVFGVPRPSGYFLVAFMEESHAARVRDSLISSEDTPLLGLIRATGIGGSGHGTVDERDGGGLWDVPFSLDSGNGIGAEEMAVRPSSFFEILETISGTGISVSIIMTEAAPASARAASATASEADSESESEWEIPDATAGRPQPPASPKEEAVVVPRVPVRLDMRFSTAQATEMQRKRLEALAHNFSPTLAPPPTRKFKPPQKNNKPGASDGPLGAVSIFMYLLGIAWSVVVS